MTFDFPSHRASRLNCGYSRGGFLSRMFVALLLVALMALFVGRAKAQPTVTGYNPTQNQKSAPVSSPISLTFSMPMNAGTASNTVFKTFGGYRGYLSGTGTYSGSGTPTITYTPAAQYKPGEKISTTITSAAQSTGAVPIAKPYVYEFTAKAGVGPATFYSAPALPGAGANTWSVCMGDFNGDGALDLASGNGSSNNISVYINTNTGSFAAPTTVGAGGNGAQTVIARDFNGDGKLDIAVTNYTNNKLGILIGNGMGGFAPVVSYTTTGGGAAGLDAGDIDGDGDLDLVVMGQSTGADIFFNNGSGVFSGPTFYSVSANATGVVFGDFDNDGDLDFAVADLIGNNVSIRFNTGFGTFGAATTYPATAAAAIVTGDFDGDGDLDLAVTNWGGPNLSVLINIGVGSGTFAAAVPYFAAGSNVLSAGDVDGDGDLDLITPNISAAGTVNVLLNSGTGTFGAPSSYTAGNNPQQAVVGDIDGDGDLDIAAANITSNNLTLLYNMSPPTAYYYRSGNAALPASWCSSPVGGIPATTFSTPGLDFIVMGGSSAVTTTTATATSALTIPAGINFRIQAPSVLAMNSGFSLTNSGSIIVEGSARSGGTLLFNAPPNFAGTVPTYQSGSTLQYAGTGNISTAVELPATMPGNLRASNIGTLTVSPAGNPVIAGNVTIDQASTLQLNAGTVTTFNGALNLNGTLAHYASGGLRGLLLNGALALNGVIKQSGASNSAVTIGGTGTVTGTLRSLDNTWKSTLTLNRPGTRLRLGGPLLMNPATPQLINLTADSCIIQTDSVNILTLSAANADITNAATSYIEGPLQRYVAPNSVGTTTAFPIGKNGQALHAILQNLNSGGNSPLLRAEAFTGATGGRADSATVGSLDPSQYWNINLLSGDVVSTNVRLSRMQSIPAGTIIAKSPAQTGVFARLAGGTIAQSGVFSTITAGTFSSFSTFALGTPYIPPPFVPSITGFSPLQTTNGTSIVLRGTNFMNVQRVSIGGVAVQSFTVDSTNQVTITIPNGLASGAITIQTALGTATSASPLTIVGAPTVTNVSPALVGAGTQVIITGTNFIPAPAGNVSGAIPVSVRIGGITASSVSVLSPTQIIATFPLGAGGQTLSGQPVVQAWGGSGVATQALIIIPPPIVSGFSPTTLASGDLLTVTGANFVQPMTVRIGNLVLNVTVNSPTRATIVLPQGQTISQSAPLTVSTPGGTATTGTVSIIGQPVISSQSPLAALPGEPITISGMNLTTVQNVFFGTTPSSFRTDSLGRIIAIVPANLPPNIPLSLTVQTLGGTATAPQAFTPRPVQGIVITSVSPLVADEGANIDISGINFPTSATVSGMASSTTFTITIGGIAVTQAFVRSSTSLTVTLPAGLLPITSLSSSATVVITTPEGAAVSAVPLTVRALNSPWLTSISDVSGGTNSTLTLIGANFGIAPRGGVLGVFVGGVPVSGFRVVSPTQIVIEPLGTVTSGTVTVLTSAGTLTLTQNGMSIGLPVQFRFVPTLQPYMPVQASDSLALAALFQATGGSAWLDGTNWLTEAVSSWHGVVIDSGRVVEIRLAANNLRGVLPVNELSQLTGLKVLDIGDNALTGDISSLLGTLRNLRTLRLSNNALTGSLDGLCSMPYLRELDIAGCGFTGSIAVFCCLNRVERLNISRNQFTGTIPSCFGDNRNLSVFDASNNQLSGTIPVSLGNAESLQTLNLSNNRLSGVIPSEFGALESPGKQVARVSALRSLQRLDLSRNSFSGAVPPTLGNLTNLRELRLGSNELSGILPEQMIQLQRLSVLDASNNRLSDAPSFKEISRLDSLRLDGNAMSFRVLEQQIGVRNFRYAPQQITPPALSDTTVLSDTPLTLHAWIAGANNRYRWRKNDVAMTSPTMKDSLGFAAFGTADSGRYSCEITNTTLPLLVVTTASALVRAVTPTTVPDSVVLIAPVKGETEVPTLPTLQWTALAGAAQYRIEFSQNANFSPLLTSLAIVQSLQALASGVMEIDTRGLNGFPLGSETHYFWRVRAENSRGSGQWTVGDFSTGTNNTLSAQRVDFGKIPRGDTVFATLNLRNQSSQSVRIDNLITADNTAFTISIPQNSTIPAESSVSLRVRFIPTTLDAVNAGITVRFVTEGSTAMQTQTISARLFGRGGALKLITPAIDTSVIGTTKLLAVQVVNVGNREVDLVRVDLRRGAREYSFRASVDGQMPVGAGDTASVLLKFVAERIGTASSESIYCQANIDTVSTPLVQYGRLRLPSDVTAGIGIRALPPVAAPGALVMVELFLTEMTPGDRDKLLRFGVPAFRASVRMNRQALVPDASGAALMRAVRNTVPRNTMQSYTVPTTYWNGRDSVLLRVPCRVVAGSTDATALVLEQLQWGDGTLQITNVMEGKFSSTISQAGGKRLISSGTSTALALSPNPANDVLEVRYTLAKSSMVVLTLLDVRGQQVGSILTEVQPKGSHILPVRVERFASGTYTLRLSIDAEEISTQQVQIVR